MARLLVRFDDRLQTVLRQPASDPRDAAVRWRQLVDLIARAGPSVDSQALGEGLAAIEEDAPRIEETLRAAAARAIAALPLPFRLLQYFITDRLAVSAPILAAASLERAQWTALLDLADPESRRFIETLHPELAPVAPAEPDMTEQLVEQGDQSAGRTIGDMVARIERRRHGGPRSEGRGPQPGQDTDSRLGVFRWECGPSGEIGWVEGAPRGTLIGRSIARAREFGDRIDDDALRAFSQRAPFRDAQMTLAGDGPVSGKWKISGVPAFDPADGRFAGYRGIALREFDPTHSALGASAPALALEADSLRELVHEIKTPLNAIIGFAEIIDGQYLGPAGRRYRQRAIGIVDQARLLLAAIDDLDRAARVQSGATPASGPAELGAILARTLEAAGSGAAQRGVDLDHSPPPQRLEAAADGELLSRLVGRLIEAAITLSAAGERLHIAAGRTAGTVVLSISRPQALADIAMVDFAEDEGGDTSAARFSVHVARGLARIAGGDVTLRGDTLALAMPAA